MTDARRRSVMQPAPDPHGNMRTGIPVPSTVKKPMASMRLSMAGPAIRAPYPVPSHAGPGTNPRQSIMRSQNVNPLLQSTSKPNYGRTPVAK
jgi:kinetochore protein NDC80